MLSLLPLRLLARFLVNLPIGLLAFPRAVPHLTTRRAALQGLHVVVHSASIALLADVAALVVSLVCCRRLLGAVLCFELTADADGLHCGTDGLVAVLHAVCDEELQGAVRGSGLLLGLRVSHGRAEAGDDEGGARLPFAHAQFPLNDHPVVEGPDVLNAHREHVSGSTELSEADGPDLWRIQSPHDSLVRCGGGKSTSDLEALFQCLAPELLLVAFPEIKAPHAGHCCTLTRNDIPSLGISWQAEVGDCLWLDPSLETNVVATSTRRGGDGLEFIVRRIRIQDEGHTSTRTMYAYTAVTLRSTYG